MDLVNLMYRYINRFMNSDELLKNIENIDLANYSENEITEIKKLILDIKNIKSSIPNKIDKIEKNRIESINNILKKLENIREINTKDDEKIEFINKQYNKLLEEKKIIKDGGKLYEGIYKLLTNNSIINKYAEKMNDKELLEFITKYISVPLPPVLTQKKFDNLVSIGIKEDKRESLWRLAFNYNKKKINFSKIEDYFIEKRDAYYLVELISSVREDLNMTKLIQKVISTKDNDFINECGNRALNIGIFTREEIEELKGLM